MVKKDFIAYPLLWGDMRDTDTPGLCIASPLTPLQRVWMCPYWISLSPQKETIVEFVSSNGAGLADLGPKVNNIYSELHSTEVATYNPGFGLRMVIFSSNCVWWPSGINGIVKYTVNYSLRSRLSYLRSKWCLCVKVCLLSD